VFTGAPLFNSFLFFIKDKNYGLRLYTSKLINLTQQNRRIYKSARRDLKLLQFKQPYKVFETLHSLTATPERRVDEDGVLETNSLNNENIMVKQKIDPGYSVLLNPIKNRASRK